MVCFLTSSPVIPGTLELNPANSFMDELHRRFQNSGRVLFICSNPDVYDKTDFFANEMKGIFENSGFSFGSFTILDSRNEHDAPELINNADLIILAGGHVPTQNRFFRRIGLKALHPEYQRFLPGLGLTKTMLLPHYQDNKDDILDGQRIYEDIAYSDSCGRVFHVIPDGSYLFIADGREELRGEAYRISDGNMQQITAENDVIRLK